MTLGGPGILLKEANNRICVDMEFFTSAGAKIFIKSTLSIVRRMYGSLGSFSIPISFSKDLELHN